MENSKIVVGYGIYFWSYRAVTEACHSLFESVKKILNNFNIVSSLIGRDQHVHDSFSYDSLMNL